MRVKYQVFIRLNYHNPSAPSPLNHGWTIKDRACVPIHFTKPALPKNLTDRAAQIKVQQPNTDTDTDWMEKLKLRMKGITIQTGFSNSSPPTQNIKLKMYAKCKFHYLMPNIKCMLKVIS